MTLSLIAVILSGFAGAIAHWFNNYTKGKTENSFWAYLKENKNHTISTFITIFASSATLYQTTPPSLTTSALITAFLAGYTLDSAMNKDNTPTYKEIKQEIKKIEDIKNEDKTKSISDLIADDDML